MTAERFIIRSREVAQLLDHSAGWFYAHREGLERAGFPKKDTLLGGWSRAAIIHWLAKRHGLVAQSADDQERHSMREAINAQKAKRLAVRHPAQ